MWTPFDTLPEIDGYSWRASRPDDAAALAALELACASVDGNKSVSDATTWQRRLADEDFREKNSVVLGSNRPTSIPKIIAAGRLWYQEEAHEIQGFLDGWVHPARRNQRIGNALLTWLETLSCINMRTRLNELGTPNLPRICRILIYHQAPHAIQLYENHGYHFQNAEDELHYDLSLPPAILPSTDRAAALAFETHSAANAADFHAAYLDAFSTRTTDLWSEESWRHHFADPTDGEFRPTVSLLAKVGKQIVGFVVCHGEEDEVKGESSIDVTQLGVGVAFRRRGLAAAILTETLRRCAAAGYPMATISVNANNRTHGGSTSGWALCCMNAIRFSEKPWMTRQR